MRALSRTWLSERADLPPAPCLRSNRFAILAMSLSSLFDILHPTDFLRSALNMLTEYEQAKEDNDRPKMVARISPFYPTFIPFLRS